MKMNVMCRYWQIHWALSLLMTFFFVGCKDSDTSDGAFDPNKPIIITDFSPKQVAVGANLVVYGDNFGIDISKVKVMIGGKEAKVIGLTNTSLYCVVPAKAYDGDIQISVFGNDGTELAYGEANERVEYIKKWIATTVVGKRYETSAEVREYEGPFDDCGAFKDILWLSLDPLNHNHLYFTADNGASARIPRFIDFENKYAYIFKHGFGSSARTSTMTWTKDGDMVLPENHTSDTKIANYLFTRASNFEAKEELCTGRGVNGTMVFNDGKLYFTVYRAGEIWRYDFTTKKKEKVYGTIGAGASSYLVGHPDGKYAYLILHSASCIYRMDYDEVKGNFGIPYIVCGKSGSKDYKDGVGTSARLNCPVQGVFVKNPDYEGVKDDQYDFYFCDKENHAIRILTPEGRVSTFAGRGNNGTSGYANGDLRTEARFNKPTGIAYDEDKGIFYIGDSQNWVIRGIEKEK